MPEPEIHEGDDGWWIAISPPGAPHMLLAAGETEAQARELFRQAHGKWQRKQARNGT